MEGADGVGKHTQVTMLESGLREEGHSVKLHGFPNYSSVFGRVIRDRLTGSVKMSNKGSFLMYLGDMVEDAPMIEKWLDEGHTVLLDRYNLSTIAYGVANGFDYDDAKKVEETFNLPRPNLVIYIDMPVERSMLLKARQRSLEQDKADIYESNRKLQENVKPVYERMFSESLLADKWVKIDGSGSIEEVHKSIMNAVNSTFTINKLRY